MNASASVAALTEEQDALLRRLGALAELGALSGPMAELYAELRARDRRREVRPVADVVELDAAPAPDPGPVVLLD